MDYYQSHLWLLQEMLKMLGQQTQLLQSLEKEVREMSQLLASLEKRAGHQVGTIEYNFDQLKIQNLNGSLTIGVPSQGINPNDLGLEVGDGWESLRKQAEEATNPDRANDEVQVGTENRPEPSEAKDMLQRYIRETIMPKVIETAKTRGIPLTEEQAESIRLDMERQTEERLQRVLRQHAGNHEAGPWLEDTIDKLQVELIQAIDRYVDYFDKEGETGGG